MSKWCFHLHGVLRRCAGRLLLLCGGKDHILNCNYLERKRFAALCVLTAVGAFGVFSSPAKGEFVAAFRERSTSCFISAVGEIYALNDERLAKAVILTDSSQHPFRWQSAVRSFARWRSQWIVADGSKRLLQFRANGVYAGVVEVPIRVGRLVTAGNYLWALNLLATKPDEQLWYSADGKKFSPLKTLGRQRPFDSPLENLVLLGGDRQGDLYAASMVGPPILRRVWPPKRALEIRLAYSRSAFRAGLEKPEGLIDDVSSYSQPVRDVLGLDDASVVIVRNREDIRNASGKLELWSGRRADRYDSVGHHVGTAVFPRSINWIASTNGTSIRGINKAGEIAIAKWETPIPGEIVKP